MKPIPTALLFCFFMLAPCLGAPEKTDSADRKLLYVATPGIRDYLEYAVTVFWCSTSVRATSL